MSLSKTIADLFSCKIVAEHKATGISEDSDTNLLLAREWGRNWLAEHNDEPEFVFETADGFAITGKTHAVLMGDGSGGGEVKELPNPDKPKPAKTTEAESRLKSLSSDVYDAIFQMLDGEVDVDGLDAGKIATACQKAYDKEIAKLESVEEAPTANFASRLDAAVTAVRSERSTVPDKKRGEFDKYLEQLSGLLSKIKSVASGTKADEEVSEALNETVAVYAPGAPQSCGGPIDSSGGNSVSVYGCSLQLSPALFIKSGPDYSVNSYVVNRALVAVLKDGMADELVKKIRAELKGSDKVKALEIELQDADESVSEAKIPDIRSDVYQKKQKFPKYNGEVSPTHPAVSSAHAGNMLRARLPDWKKTDHAAAAKYHDDEAMRKQKEWARTQEKAHMAKYGKKPEATDYKISGIGDDGYSDDHKDALRTLAHDQGDHKSAAAAHKHLATYLREDGTLEETFHVSAQFDMENDDFDARRSFKAFEGLVKKHGGKIFCDFASPRADGSGVIAATMTDKKSADALAKDFRHLDMSGLKSVDSEENESIEEVESDVTFESIETALGPILTNVESLKENRGLLVIIDTARETGAISEALEAARAIASKLGFALELQENNILEAKPADEVDLDAEGALVEFIKQMKGKNHRIRKPKSTGPGCCENDYETQLDEMNAGKDKAKAAKQAQANANSSGQPRYVHQYGGAFWISKERPKDADNVEEFKPEKKTTESRAYNFLLARASAVINKGQGKGPAGGPLVQTGPGTQGKFSGPKDGADKNGKLLKEGGTSSGSMALELVCPKCGQNAQFVPVPDTYPQKVRCENCGHTGYPANLSEGVEPEATTVEEGMTWWDVFLDGKEIDSVPYDGSYKTAEEVKKSLVNHDGYDDNIVVKKSKRGQGKGKQKDEGTNQSMDLQFTCPKCKKTDDFEPLPDDYGKCKCPNCGLVAYEANGKAVNEADEEWVLWGHKKAHGEKPVKIMGGSQKECNSAQKLREREGGWKLQIVKKGDAPTPGFMASLKEADASIDEGKYEALRQKAEHASTHANKKGTYQAHTDAEGAHRDAGNAAVTSRLSNVAREHSRLSKDHRDKAEKVIQGRLQKIDPDKTMYGQDARKKAIAMDNESVDETDIIAQIKSKTRESCKLRKGGKIPAAQKLEREVDGLIAQAKKEGNGDEAEEAEQDAQNESANYDSAAWLNEARHMTPEQFATHLEEAADSGDLDGFNVKVDAIVEAYRADVGEGKRGREWTRKITAANPFIKRVRGKGIDFERLNETTESKVNVIFHQDHAQRFLEAAQSVGVPADHPCSEVSEATLSVSLPRGQADKIQLLFNGGGIKYEPVNEVAVLSDKEKDALRQTYMKPLDKRDIPEAVYKSLAKKGYMTQEGDKHRTTLKCTSFFETDPECKAHHEAKKS